MGINKDVVGPSPVGTWEFSMPQLKTQGERERVTEIQLDLILSFVPCETPDCSGEADSSVAAAQRQNVGSQFGTLVTFSPGLAALGLTLVVASGLAVYRKQRRILAPPTAHDVA